MSLQINLRHLETQSLRLQGEILPADLDLQSGDELIALNHPLRYDLDAQMLEQAVLVQGRLELPIDCECVRCLKPFAQTMVIEPWACHLPLEGEDKVSVVNDLVDLTPYLREDIFLAFPQHPLCDASCSGLKKPVSAGGKAAPGAAGAAAQESPDAGAETSPWSVLDKLKLK